MTWDQIVGIINNPFLAMVAKIIGISAFSVWAHRFAIVQGWVQSPKGQALLSDGVQGIQLIEKIAADSGHPAKNQAAQVLLNVQAFVKSIPPAAKALLIGFALLALAGHARASSLSLGPISLSPSAGAPTVIVQPFLVAETWAVAGNITLGLRDDKIGGIQAGPEWGPYGIGLAVGIDEDTEAAVTYLTGGAYVEFMPWGEVLILARNGGATLSLTIPWELGGSVTN